LDPLQSEPKRIRKSQHRYSCSQCKYFALTTRNLKIHVDSKHEGVRFPCPECDFAATTAGILKTHVESIHEGVRYPCSKCEYAATTAGILKNQLKVYTKE